MSGDDRRPAETHPALQTLPRVSRLARCAPRLARCAPRLARCAPWPASLRSPRRPAAPRLLGSILDVWDRLARRRRHIRPARPDALVGVELRRHQGADVVLRDGVIVRRGDLLGELHLDNIRVRDVTRREGWFAIEAARDDLRAIARWTARQAPAARPVAYHASSLLGPLAARTGFDTRPRRRTVLARLDEWYLRWLMTRWSADGRRRLGRGHGRLRLDECWLSADALVARHGRAMTKAAMPAR